MFDEEKINEKRVGELLNIEEDYFNDLKAKEIAPAKLSETVSAFANASGGDIFVGIREDLKNHTRQWDGFIHIEDANQIIQMLENLAALQNYYIITFLKHPIYNTYVLQITVLKALDIIYATNEKAYIRKNAQKLPVDTDEKMRRLELDKGIIQFENELVQDSDMDDAVNSQILDWFSNSTIPNMDKMNWLNKQRLVKNGKLTVAGTLLFTDEPQASLPKRSAIKIFRYKTTGKADRDMLDGQPITIEGCAYQQIYDAVTKVKEVIESIKKLGKGFENIKYPEETLHEIITNAVLHRDYSIPTDIQIRIYDNRVEIESPGKLPGSVTVKNILDTQAARNPKIVRLINKFPNAPNKDVGEGLNTAFDAMKKLRLKDPEIQETETSVLVKIKHEKLASPEQIVMEYLQDHEFIKNDIGRKITGIKSENSMKTVFYHLRDQGFIELIHGKNIWKKREEKKVMPIAQKPRLIKLVKKF